MRSGVILAAVAFAMGLLVIYAAKLPGAYIFLAGGLALAAYAIDTWLNTKNPDDLRRENALKVLAIITTANDIDAKLSEKIGLPRVTDIDLKNCDWAFNKKGEIFIAYDDDNGAIHTAGIDGRVKPDSPESRIFCHYKGYKITPSDMKQMSVNAKKTEFETLVEIMEEKGITPGEAAEVKEDLNKLKGKDDSGRKP